MARAIALRSDSTGAELRALARQSKDASQVTVPDTMTPLPLPAKCPELNVMENVWQFMRDNWLSNRVFTGHNDIVGLCCFYWNRLIEMPWRIMSIGMHDWAHRF